MAKHKLLVVGAGPAGLMAAGRAAARGLQVQVLEKMPQPARKLGLTGKGRCNLTNIAHQQEFLASFGPKGQFLRPALTKFSNWNLLDLLKQLGVQTVVERGGRVFPARHSAPQIARILVSWARSQGAKLHTQAELQEILLKNKRIQGARIKFQSRFEKGFQIEDIFADSLLLATGGASYPATGSTGEGFRLAAALGHTVLPLRPALVPLETKGDLAPRLQGLSLRNVQAVLFVQGKMQTKAFGEMLFTHFGVSGPIILSLSKHAAQALEQGQKVGLVLDLKPAVSHAKLQARISHVLHAKGKQNMTRVLRDFLPPKMIPVCLEKTGIPPEKKGSQVSAQEQKRLRLWLKELTLDICSCRPLEEAIITAGGVSLGEVDPRSMSSRLITGLYFAGEVLDLDAYTGGYNLQAAFSTGWLAGDAAGS